MGMERKSSFPFPFPCTKHGRTFHQTDHYFWILWSHHKSMEVFCFFKNYGWATVIRPYIMRTNEVTSYNLLVNRLSMLKLKTSINIKLNECHHNKMERDFYYQIKLKVDSVDNDKPRTSQIKVQEGHAWFLI